MDWQVTETNAYERRNLFSMTPGREQHLATIISGSRSKADQFNECVRLIELLPDMLNLLKQTSAALHDIAFLENATLRDTRQRIDELLRRVDEKG